MNNVANTSYGLILAVFSICNCKICIREKVIHRTRKSCLIQYKRQDIFSRYDIRQQMFSIIFKEHFSYDMIIHNCNRNFV